MIVFCVVLLLNWVLCFMNFVLCSIVAWVWDFCFFLYNEILFFNLLILVAGLSMSLILLWLWQEFHNSERISCFDINHFSHFSSLDGIKLIGMVKKNIGLVGSKQLVFEFVILVKLICLLAGRSL